MSKIKKITVKFLLALTVGLFVSGSVNTPTTYAAQGACANDKFNEVEPGKCIGPAGQECTVEAGWPEGWTKAPDVEGQTICSKFISTGSATPEDLANVKMLVRIQAFLNRALWPVLVLIGGLMDNDLLFGNGMEERLNEIWIIIRNLVNILFVIVLVGIALYNILGLGEDGGNYAIKIILPKIIIAIIAVNFSFTAIKVFLDAINVLTVSVFTLPDTVNEGLSKILPPPDTEERRRFVEGLCKALSGLTVAEFNAISDQKLETVKEDLLKVLVAKKYIPSIKETDPLTVVQPRIDALNAEQRKLYNDDLLAAKQGQICFKKNGLTAQGELFLSRYNSRNAAFAMALNMGKITFYDQISAEGLKNVEKLTINTLFSAVFYLIFAASFIALFIVLLARLVVMWLCIALSPLLILTFAEPTLKEKLGGFSKLSEQFTKMAMAPLIIALSMSIGWIMLKAIQGLSSFQQGTALHVGNTLGIPIAGLSTLQDLTVALGTIAVVWLGVFAASEGTIAQGATDMIKGAVTKAGKWLGTLPLKHMPLTGISVPGAPGEKFTLGEGLYAVQQAFQDHARPKLWNALMGQDTVTVDTLNSDKVKTPEDFNRWLKWAKESKQDLMAPAFVKALNDFRNADKNRWNNLDRAIRDPLDIVLDTSKDKDQREKAAKNALDNSFINQSSIKALEGTTIKSDGTPSAPTAPSAPGMKDDDTFQGRSLDDRIPDKDKREAEKDRLNGQFNELGRELDTLKQSNEKGEGIAADDPKLQDIKRAISQGLKLNDELLTPQELEKYLGKEKYDYLLLALGSGKKANGENALKQLLERPEPPASPPPAGAPPAGPAAPPSPPAASP